LLSTTRPAVAGIFSAYAASAWGSARLGTASRTRSLSLMSASLARTTWMPSSFTPGRYGFSPSFAMRAACSRVRVPSCTSRPAFLSVTARLVP
jgi:hypothetical protein